MRKLHLAIVPIFAVVVAAVVLFPRATPRPAAPVQVPVSPGQQVAPATEQRTGAPLRAEPVTGSAWWENGEEWGFGPRVSGAPTPRPSGGIGQPASYCRPKFCETPEPVSLHLSRPGATAVVGTATYYCRPGISRCTRGYPFGMYAAAGPELRAMLGDWRGRTVVVIDANGRGVLVQLIDWCACGGDHVIDLYWTAYQGLVNPVTVREQP